MFSKRLKKLRQERELDQPELAKILNLSTSAISMWERGEREPTRENLKAIATFFGVTTDYLLCRTDNRDKVIEDTPEFINSNLALLRGTRNIEDFAKQLKLSPDILARYENGEEEPIPSILDYIAQTENIPVTYFYTVHDKTSLEQLRNQCNTIMYKTITNNSLDFLDEEIKNWVNNPENKEYLQFIYKAYKNGISKDLLNKIQITIKIDA